MLSLPKPSQVEDINTHSLFFPWYLSIGGTRPTLTVRHLPRRRSPFSWRRVIANTQRLITMDHHWSKRSFAGATLRARLKSGISRRSSAWRWLPRRSLYTSSGYTT